MSTSQKAILVTGSPRSGSTWLGKMLAVSPEVVYLHEPFNPQHNLGMCAAEFKYWFTYLCAENASAYEGSLRDTIRLRYNLSGVLHSASGPRAVAHEIRQALRFRRYQLQKKRALVKDPIAVFSAEWLAATFNMDVVVLIRHPAAFAESMKSKGWTHDFSHFLAQPKIMHDILFPFESEIREFVEKKQDLIDQAALLWKLVYYMVDIHCQKHPEWIYVRHEDLSRDPIQGYQKLYQQLNLKFTRKVQTIIESHSVKEAAELEDVDHQPHDIQRNSKALLDKWKRRLTPDEIARIKARVGEISQRFYSEDEW